MKYLLKFLLVALFALPIPFIKSVKAQAQNPGSFSTDYKNELSAGVYIAVADVSGSGDCVSLFYEYEYIHGLNKLFGYGIGMGFFNNQKVPSKITYSDGYVYQEYNQTSVMSVNFSGFIDIIKTRKSLLRFGVGYTGRFVKVIYSPITYFDNIGSLRAASMYERIKGYESGILAHSEYGYRVSSHIMASFNINVYSVGKYSGFYMAGFNISYCF